MEFRTFRPLRMGEHTDATHRRNTALSVFHDRDVWNNGEHRIGRLSPSRVLMNTRPVPIDWAMKPLRKRM